MSLPENFYCEIRALEFGDFTAWSECDGKGLTLNYTSYEWSNAERTVCNLNATDSPFEDVGSYLSNVNMCDLVIGV